MFGRGQGNQREGSTTPPKRKRGLSFFLLLYANQKQTQKRKERPDNGTKWQ